MPFPLLISKHVSNESGFQSDPPKEWAYFITTGIIISALALPIVMARIGTVSSYSIECQQDRSCVEPTL